MSLISLSSILELFSDEISVFRKGENSLESGNVLEIHFDGSLGVIRGRVLASMKKSRYHVEIYMNQSSIQQFQCDCARGQFKCHHICAVLLYAHKNFSKTDTICQWKAPSSLSEGTATVRELFSKTTYRATNRRVDKADKEFFYNKLKSLNRFSGLFFLLSPEEPINKRVVKSFSNILDLSKNEKGEIVKEEVLVNFKASPEEILHVAEATNGQNENAVWHQMRLGRLTASNFGVVLNACQKNRYPPSLLGRLLGKANLNGVKSIQWGLNHELTAIKEFEQNEKLQVTPTGLWFHECGFLGASPDGFVGDDSIIEIKCPFRHRNSSIDKIKNDKNYCFSENLNLKQSHVYFHQIQGLLHITKRSICHLVVWTPTLYIKVDVVKDANWLPNLVVLEKFYISHLLDKFLE